MDFNYGNNKYKAVILKWSDGDTVHLRVDLGQHVFTQNSYRLMGLDAPETALRKGVTAAEKIAGGALKRRINEMYPPGTEVWVSTSKDGGKYGRYLVNLWVGGEGTLRDLNQWLLDEGLAVKFGPGNWAGWLGADGHGGEGLSSG